MDATGPNSAHPPDDTGASSAWQVRVQQAPFDVSAEMAQMQDSDLGIGGIGLFVGTVRDLRPADAAPVPALEALELEHYPGMTERLLADMLQQARRRFDLRAGRIVHRVGRLGPGEPIVLVMAAAAHRHAALDGCAFLMDWLKTDAPFWKKEHAGGQGRWVDARAADDRALARWGRHSGNAGGQALAADPERGDGGEGAP